MQLYDQHGNLIDGQQYNNKQLLEQTAAAAASAAAPPSSAFASQAFNGIQTKYARLFPL
jgi:hypothetical protein